MALCGSDDRIWVFVIISQLGPPGPPNAPEPLTPQPTGPVTSQTFKVRITTYVLILSGMAELARASFGCFEGRVLFFGFDTLQITLRGVWDEPSHLFTDPPRVARASIMSVCAC
jgi:hypothetical protein